MRRIQRQRSEWLERVERVGIRMGKDGRSRSKNWWCGTKVYEELWVEYLRERRARRVYARRAVASAVKAGILSRPAICSRCGKECVPEAHHRSYREEDWLDVEWLGVDCHRLVHQSIC